MAFGNPRPGDLRDTPEGETPEGRETKEERESWVIGRGPRSTPVIGRLATLLYCKGKVGVGRVLQSNWAGAGVVLGSWSWEA
jgi:hypothetical protein